MSIRKFLPILGLVVFALGGVAFVLITGADRSEEKIESAVLKYVRERISGVEGKDYTIGAVEILSRTDDRAVAAVSISSLDKKIPSDMLLLIREEEGGWRVSEDLRDYFSRIATAADFVREVGNRLSRRYAERYRLAVTIKEGTPFRVGVSRSGKNIVGTFEFRFSIARSDGKFDRGLYNERFLFDGREWALQGTGQLLEGYAPR